MQNTFLLLGDTQAGRDEFQWLEVHLALNNCKLDWVITAYIKQALL